MGIVQLLLLLVPLAFCQDTLAPDAAGALTQVATDEEKQGWSSQTTDTAGAVAESTQRVTFLLKGAQDALQQLAASIGSRLWNESTEEEQQTVNTTIAGIESVLETAVRQDFNASQKQIESHVADLLSKTNTALAMKKKANEEDGELDSCRTTEKALLIETTERLSTIKSTRLQKDAVCQRKLDNQNFTWANVAATGGLCDFSDVTTEGVCVPFASLQSEVEAREQAILAQQTLHKELTIECNRLMDELDSLIRETTINNVPGNTAFTTRRLQCDRDQRQAQVAMCTFGDRLQEKCQSKADADNLVVQVYHQQEDRIAQWNASQLIKCKLMRFRHGETLEAMNVSLVPSPVPNCSEDVYVNDKGELKGGCVHDGMPASEKPCEFMLNFAKDVGTMDYMLAAIDSQMTSDNFNCDEKLFSFLGHQWQTGSEASDYFKRPFEPAVTLNPLGAKPFEFCA